ncbi:hypothetical protein AAKU67_000222 [Oxalobacteraceae bacterium GrIS 2.11]
MVLPWLWKKFNMLRNALLGFTFVIACIGVLLCLVGAQPAWPIAIWGSVIFVLILLERWRYQHTNLDAPGEWQATDEQFIDPETGKLTRVLYKAATGERRYVVVEDN